MELSQESERRQFRMGSLLNKKPLPLAFSPDSKFELVIVSSEVDLNPRIGFVNHPSLSSPLLAVSEHLLCASFSDVSCFSFIGIAYLYFTWPIQNVRPLVEEVLIIQFHFINF